MLLAGMLEFPQDVPENRLREAALRTGLGLGLLRLHAYHEGEASEVAQRPETVADGLGLVGGHQAISFVICRIIVRPATLLATASQNPCSTHGAKGSGFCSSHERNCSDPEISETRMAVPKRPMPARTVARRFGMQFSLCDMMSSSTHSMQSGKRRGAMGVTCCVPITGYMEERLLAMRTGFMGSAMSAGISRATISVVGIEVGSMLGV